MFEEIAEKVSDRVIDAEAVQFTASRVNCDICERKISKWLIEICTVRMCCKCYSPILTLKGNICLLEMTIGRLMIALLPVHLCSAMVPRTQGERVHEAQTSDHLTLCPTGMGMGVAGVDVVVVSIGELLISELTERRWLRAAVLMVG